MGRRRLLKTLKQSFTLFQNGSWRSSMPLRGTTAAQPPGSGGTYSGRYVRERGESQAAASASAGGEDACTRSLRRPALLAAASIV